MAASLAVNSGSRLRLKLRMRWGWSLWAAQIRCTVRLGDLTLGYQPQLGVGEGMEGQAADPQQPRIFRLGTGNLFFQLVEELCPRAALGTKPARVIKPAAPWLPLHTALLAAF